MSAQAYRRYAADCLKLSNTVIDPKVRAYLRHMAVAWTDLVDQAERNLRNDVVYETPPMLQQPQKDKKE
jgi:hypothetical protein